MASSSERLSRAHTSEAWCCCTSSVTLSVSMDSGDDPVGSGADGRSAGGVMSGSGPWPASEAGQVESCRGCPSPVPSPAQLRALLTPEAGSAGLETAVAGWRCAKEPTLAGVLGLEDGCSEGVNLKSLPVADGRARLSGSGRRGPSCSWEMLPGKAWERGRTPMVLLQGSLLGADTSAPPPATALLRLPDTCLPTGTGMGLLLGCAGEAACCTAAAGTGRGFALEALFA